MATPGDTLVKYENPVLLSEARRRRGAQGRTKQQQATEDILNSILPPREWEEDGQRWIQFVASTPATRMDVINLQEKLDAKIQQRQAREMGICPVREQLYAQTFDEIIRQVTVSCAERGLLLLRIRDEIRMTIANYRTLYESSVAFGMRKALQAEQQKADMQQDIKGLEKDCDELRRQVADLTERCVQVERDEAQRRESDAKSHAQEVAKLKKMNDKLVSSLQTLLGSK
eukprot:TRINITY_DN6053_c3_g2_i1.p1 TRINITY_DN6053_c3_g2~~TRINITY_DN6053_c3_g2_i1.p1  ORF type:complete len:229 (+),score=88.26 TRINITY_DN6053_c3_g2_i1:82-768(+)